MNSSECKEKAALNAALNLLDKKRYEAIKKCNNKIYEDIHVSLEYISDCVFHIVEVIEMDKEEVEELENDFKHLKTLLGCYKDNFEQTITLWDSSNATNIGHIPNDKRIDLMIDKKEAVSEFIDYWLNLKQPIEKLSPSGFISKL